MKKILSVFLAAALLFGGVVSCFAVTDLTHPFRPSDIATGLVGYWAFNNNSNATTGTNLTNGTAYPTYTATDYWKSGEYSADFEAGSSQYLTGGDIHDMNGKSFSVSLWVKAETVSSTMLWASKGNMGASGWGFGITADGVNVWINDQSTLYGTLPTNGRWTHYVATYNSSTAVVSIFQDGNLVKTASNSGTISGNATAFIVGANNGGANYFWDGLIKDLAVWETVLTPQQIKSLAMGVDLSSYTYRPSDVSTQPTHWWKLNELNGNRADSVATNPLTLTDNNTVSSSGGYQEAVAANFVVANAEYLSRTDSADFDFSGGVFSMSLFLKPNSIGYGGSGNYVWRNYDTGYDNYSQLVIGTDGKINFWVVAGGNYVVQVNGTTVLKAGTMYHVVVRENGDTWKIFIDGVDDTASGGTDTSRTNNYNDSFLIGIAGNLSDFVIQDFAIWKSYALTDAEIKSLAAGMPIQQQGVLAYWKLEDTADSFGTHTLTNNGSTTFTTGLVGNAASITTNKYFTAADSADWDFGTDEFDFSFWAKITTVSTQQTFFDRDATNGIYNVLQYSGDEMNFVIENGGKSFYLISTYHAALANTTWYHYNFSRRGGTAYFNVDGIYIEPNGEASTEDIQSDQVLYIGRNVANNLPSAGLYDEFLVWKRGLRPEEIKALYLKGLNGKEATSSEKAPAPGGKHRMLMVF